MKFGIFYEHQLPRPWEPGAELRLFQHALDQVGQPINLPSIKRGRIKPCPHSDSQTLLFFSYLRIAIGLRNLP